MTDLIFIHRKNLSELYDIHHGTYCHFASRCNFKYFRESYIVLRYHVTEYIGSFVHSFNNCHHHNDIIIKLALFFVIQFCKYRILPPLPPVGF